MITVCPSGETVAAMLVPSWNTRFRVEQELPLGTAAIPPKRTAVSTKAGARRDVRRCGCKVPLLGPDRGRPLRAGTGGALVGALAAARSAAKPPGVIKPSVRTQRTGGELAGARPGS